MGFEVVYRSEEFFDAIHSRSFFPRLSFLIFVLLFAIFVFEYLPILFPKSIPNRIIFFALKCLARKTHLSPSATIFVMKLNLFNTGIQDRRDGPAPITNTFCSNTLLRNLLRGNLFFRRELSNFADSRSLFLL